MAYLATTTTTAMRGPAATPVLFVQAQDAKQVKSLLETRGDKQRRKKKETARNGLLDVRFRMAPASEEVYRSCETFHRDMVDEHLPCSEQDQMKHFIHNHNGMCHVESEPDQLDTNIWVKKVIPENCSYKLIAVPVTNECYGEIVELLSNSKFQELDKQGLNAKKGPTWLSKLLHSEWLLGCGHQVCPDSSRTMASSMTRLESSRNNIKVSNQKEKDNISILVETLQKRFLTEKNQEDAFSVVEVSLFETLLYFLTNCNDKEDCQASLAKENVLDLLLRCVIYLRQVTQSQIHDHKRSKRSNKKPLLFCPPLSMVEPIGMAGDTMVLPVGMYDLVTLTQYESNLVHHTQQAKVEKSEVQGFCHDGFVQSQEEGKRKKLDGKIAWNDVVYRVVKSAASCNSSTDNEIHEKSDEDGLDSEKRNSSQTTQNSTLNKPLCSSILSLWQSLVIPELYHRLALCLSRVSKKGNQTIRRLVQRGEIDPCSPIRHSGHTLLYHVDLHRGENVKAGNNPNKSDGCPDQRGNEEGFVAHFESAPGFITMLEHSISYSYDLTKTMYCRGNISYKHYFGTQSVQPDEVVLDMYAGIGYYVLPALIMGRAKHVYACEWNEEAVKALKYNIWNNGIANQKVTVWTGDCRECVRQAHVLKSWANLPGRGVDRVSLGLLPSSEGGWRTAVGALRQDVGGWLHVHGNVKGEEEEVWVDWLCRSLWRLAELRLEKEEEDFGVQENDNREEGSNKKDSITALKRDWVVVCTAAHRVKSFAPRVYHVVADTFVGPRGSSPVALGTGHRRTYAHAYRFVAGDSKNMKPLDEVITKPPSCALNPTGVLHQEWLMDNEVEKAL